MTEEAESLRRSGWTTWIHVLNEGHPHQARVAVPLIVEIGESRLELISDATRQRGDIALRVGRDWLAQWLVRNDLDTAFAYAEPDGSASVAHIVTCCRPRIWSWLPGGDLDGPSDALQLPRVDRPERVEVPPPEKPIVALSMQQRIDDLAAVTQRLLSIDIDVWGPDGVRYVCFLFVDELGIRLIKANYDPSYWRRWDQASGELWDLFIAGCDFAGTADPDEWTDDRHLDRAQRLAEQVELEHRRALTNAGHAPGMEVHGPFEPWSFAGPIELVVVGVRRLRSPRWTLTAGGAPQLLEWDWASLRWAVLEPRDLPRLVAEFTHAHATLDETPISPRFPVPGDFEDHLRQELRQALRRRVPPVLRLAQTLLRRW